MRALRRLDVHSFNRLNAERFENRPDLKGLAIGDLDDDGASDLAVANSFSDNLSVLLNAPVADPDFDSLALGSPAAVPQGTIGAPQAVTIGNDGSAPLAIRGFALTGSAGPLPQGPAGQTGAAGAPGATGPRARARRVVCKLRKSKAAKKKRFACAVKVRPVRTRG